MAGKTETKKVAGTVILRCVCKSAYQDKQYGANNRVHNRCVKGARCTVCSRERDA